MRVGKSHLNKINSENILIFGDSFTFGVGLEYEENADMDRKIRETTDFSGTLLKEIREYKNVAIDRMAEMTRISKTHLTALENDDIAKLPADVYVRGYVYQYAKVLKLNPDQVAQSYLLHFKKLKTKA
jgi:hypothetical protein